MQIFVLAEKNNSHNVWYNLGERTCINAKN